MSEKGLDSKTKTRILDAAEKLFGLYGFEATSLRAITAAAKVNLAAVNYHFQSKDSLIDAVIARRIGPINQRRFEMLAAAGDPPTVEEIMQAFIAPVVEAEVDVMHFKQLFGRIFAAPEEFVTRVFEKHLREVFIRFREALARALPEVADEERTWGILFAVGSMSLPLALGGVIPKMTRGACDPADHAALARRLVAFTSAGLRQNPGASS